jgi:rhodanese-related sulfurtransferase
VIKFSRYTTELEMRRLTQKSISTFSHHHWHFRAQRQPAQINRFLPRLLSNSSSSHENHIVTFSELKNLISSSSSPSYRLIDVREPSETEQGKIPTAKTIPVGELENALDLPSTKFDLKWGFEKPKPDDHLIFYCRSGKRSTLASDIAISKGYKR